jgi:hypothetical protein
VSPEEPFRSRVARRARKTALIVGGAGWAWGSLLILSVFPSFLHHFDDPEPWAVGRLGNAFATVKPVDRELLGPLANHTNGRGVCDKMWFDRDEGTLLRGVGPSNGSSAPAWLTLTVGGHVVVSRVTVDLWNGVGDGTGGLESSTSFIVANNLRVVERLPPPRPGPPGWRVIRPGECVLGSTESQDPSGIIGRFLVDLPGQRSVGVWLSQDSKGDYIPLDEKLTLNGHEVSEVQVRYLQGNRYRTEKDDRYELTIRRTDGPAAAQPIGSAPQHYSVAVAWGAAITDACSPPDPTFDCFQGVQP